MVAGVGADGNAEHLVLMKLPLDFWTQDKREMEQRNAKVLEGIFRGEQILGAENSSSQDRNLMYVKTEQSHMMKPLFSRPPRKAQ